MNKRKLGLAVAAMLLATQIGSAVAATPNLEQLNTIADILERNDVEGLRAFVLANPSLLEGDSQLAVLLRRFLEASADIGDYLAFGPDLSDAFADLPSPDAPAQDDDDGSGGIY